MTRVKVDGIWDVGILRIHDPALDTELTLQPEELSLFVAGWLLAREANGVVVAIPVTPEDIDRMTEWLKCAGENVVERRRRSQGGE